DLVSYYRFEDNANDAKTSNNGSTSNVSYNTAKFNKGIIGNGSNSLITFSDIFNFSGTQAFSVSFWAKFSSLSTTQTIAHKPSQWEILMSGKTLMFRREVDPYSISSN